LAHGISLVDVSLTYPSATAPALQEITLDIPAGSVVALVGDNGAGKSTLVKLLCGLYHPTRGQILIDGVDARDIDNEQWRARICAGFQDFVHFEFLAPRGFDGWHRLEVRVKGHPRATIVARSGYSADN